MCTPDLGLRMKKEIYLDPPSDKPSILHTKTLDAYKNKKYKKRFDVSDHSGLGVRVFESGQVSFHYRYRFDKKAKRLTLGKYPDLSLSEARDYVPKIRQLIKENKDPAIFLFDTTIVKKPDIFDCVALFLERRVPKLRPSTQKLYEYSLNKHVVNANHSKKLFKKPIEEIGIQEWFTYFDYIEDHFTPITARDILVRLKTCFRFCIRRGLISGVKVLEIPPKDVGKGSEDGERVVDIDELKVIWKEIDRSKCYLTTGNTIKMCMLTAARLGEVRNMERKDINFKKGQWIVPKEKSKTKSKIIRPLAPIALKILKQQFETFDGITDYVFPSGSYKNPISPQTVNKFCRQIIKRKNQMEPWSIHDFRRSLSTLLTDKKVPIYVTEKMLGHSLGGILKIYNKSTYIDEQLDAYKTWEEMLDKK